MKRKLKTELNHINEQNKNSYHRLSEILTQHRDRTDPDLNCNRVSTAFMALDIAISEINEAIGKGRHD